MRLGGGRGTLTSRLEVVAVALVAAWAWRDDGRDTNMLSWGFAIEGVCVRGGKCFCSSGDVGKERDRSEARKGPLVTQCDMGVGTEVRREGRERPPGIG